MKRFLTKKNLIISTMAFIMVLVLFMLHVQPKEYEETINLSEKNENMLSMNLEQTAGVGDYKTVTQNSWPTESYKFNSELSKCENGSTLSWDDTHKVVIVSGNLSDKCYIYFDIWVPSIADYCTSGTDLATCVKNFGDQGVDVSNIYIHNSSLENGAGDNSYRFAGGDYVLTDAGKATGATMIMGYNNTVTTSLIDFYCDNTKQFVGYGCSSSLSYYYLLKNDDNQYQTYSEVLNVALEKGYLTKDNIKNFVCFGTDASPCPADNLYRIIGVFDGKVKLIKWTYAKSALLGENGNYAQKNTDFYYSAELEDSLNNSLYYWSYPAIKNTWSESELNKTNLNINFINNIGTFWSNKIFSNTWQVGGNTWANLGTSAFNVSYQNEIINPAENVIYNAKIGLIYLSDYGYDATPSFWISPLYNSDASKGYQSSKDNNWLYGGGLDWTITPRSGDTSNAFRIHHYGGAGTTGANGLNSIRPTFFFEQTVTYISGDGTKSNPIRIN